MHRGNEKLPENCDFRQVIGYHDRTDYLAQFNTEHCYVKAVEKLAGITPPERAEYIRVILAELNRIASHLMFFGAFGTDIGLFGTSFMYAFRDRETIQDFFEEITGERMMYNYFRPGGVGLGRARQLQSSAAARCSTSSARGVVDTRRACLSENEVVLARTPRALAVSDRKTRSTGASPARCCARPACRTTSAAPSRTPSTTASSSTSRSGQQGDVYDRMIVRLEEMKQSVRIIEQALARPARRADHGRGT